MDRHSTDSGVESRDPPGRMMSAFESPAAEQRHLRFLAFLLLTAIALLWLAPLTSSLWLDETGTYWIIADRFAAVAERTALFRAAASPLYFMIAWGAKHALGAAEWALRLPSVLAALLCARVLYLIGRYMGDRETGLLAALAFATYSPVAFAAADARPYACGLLCVTAAMYFLLRLDHDGHSRDACAYAVCAGLSTHFHELFATMFAVHAVVLCKMSRHRRQAAVGPMATSAVIVVLLALPLLPMLVSRVGEQTALSWATTPAITDLAGFVVPPTIGFALFVGVLLAAWLVPPVRFSTEGLEVCSDLRILAWALLPPCILFLVASATPAQVFVPRYALCAAPGLCLLVGGAIRTIAGQRARRIIALALLGLSIAGTFGLSHAWEDWRGAIAQARLYLVTAPHTPVLVRSGFVETRDVRWLHDPAKRSVVLAPFTAYALDAEPIPLPWDVAAPWEEAYLESVVDRHIRHADRFVLIARHFGGGAEVFSWLRGRLAPLGFCATPVFQGGGVGTWLFDHAGCSKHRRSETEPR